MFRSSPLNPLKATLLFYLFGCAGAAFFFPFEPRYLWAMAAHYVWFGLSSSLYYHRCLSHRSFRIPAPVEIFFLLGGLVSMNGNPIRWATLHRYHHQHSDQEDDAHSPREGFYWAYFGWIAHMDDAKIAQLKGRCADLEERWFLRAASNTAAEILVHDAYLLAWILLFGWGPMLWCVCVPILLSYHFHWMFIATFCHLPFAGRRGHATSDQSRNIGWLGLLTFGESFHNNHHAHPETANNAYRWWQMDLTAWLIRLLEVAGVATNVCWHQRESAGASPRPTQAAEEPAGS